MRLRTSDNVTYELPRSFVEKWHLLRNVEEVCGSNANVAVPFSSHAVGLLVRYGDDHAMTMSEASHIIEYFNADGGEEWRTHLEVDADYGDRRRAYLELGLYLRTTRKFYHVHDWKGYSEAAVRYRPDLDFDALREKASNLDLVSLITGIYYSIYKYGGSHHWEAVALYLPSGFLHYMEDVNQALLRTISSSSQTKLSPVILSRLASKEYSLHLSMFDKVELGSTRCRTADALAGIYHGAWRYSRMYNMAFVVEGEMVTIAEPTYSVTNHLGTLITSASESDVRLFITHLIYTRRDGECISSVGLGGLIGSKKSSLSEVDKSIAEVVGYGCREVAIVILESLCSSQRAPFLIEQRLGEECTRHITAVLRKFEAECRE